MSSRTRTRRNTQHPRKAPATQPPLRLVDLTKPQPPISLTKPQPATAPLPVREFITHAAITAYHHARQNGLPTTRIRDWVEQPDGTVQTDRGTHGTLTHTPGAPTPFLATIPCQHAAHQYAITTGGDLLRAETATWACRSDHDAYTTPTNATRAHNLGHAIHRATAAAADTQQTDVTTLRAAYDQPKEHPQP